MALLPYEENPIQNLIVIFVFHHDFKPNTLQFWPHVSPTPGDQTLAEAQLAENIHHRLHGRVVGDSEGAEVKDAPQLQRLRVAGRQLRRILGEVDH